MRQLAERTSQSAQQIAAVIERVQAGARQAAAEMGSSVKRVSADVHSAHQAGDSVIGIQQGTERVVSVVEDIVDALREQSAASQDIARELQTLSMALDESVARFRTT